MLLLLTYNYRISQTAYVCKSRKDLAISSDRSSMASNYLAIASYDFQLWLTHCHLRLLRHIMYTFVNRSSEQNNSKMNVNRLQFKKDICVQ